MNTTAPTATTGDKDMNTNWQTATISESAQPATNQLLSTA
jgi:hypothetical protein